MSPDNPNFRVRPRSPNARARIFAGFAQWLDETKWQKSVHNVILTLYRPIVLYMRDPTILGKCVRYDEKCWMRVYGVEMRFNGKKARIM